MNTKKLIVTTAGSFGLLFLPGCADNCFDDGLFQEADPGCPVVSADGTDSADSTAGDTADSSGDGGSCANGVQDGDETDVDCGGSCDQQCGDGEGCQNDTDCESKWCDGDMTCDSPSCSDKLENGDETDVDCGGSVCEPCDDGEDCEVNEDCQSEQCEDGTCIGSACDDGVQNGQETDVDCGGPVCDPCPTGDGCQGPEDCESGVCDSETEMCVAPTCFDSVQNGNETDLDCGGMCGSTCEPGEGCIVNFDCTHFVCDPATDTCAEPTCTDGTPNGNETDVDCGGPDCPPCDEPGICNVNEDCMSGQCDDGNCVPPTCVDGLLNGLETDVDCGGPNCQPCDDGEICLGDSDCESTICDAIEPLPGICIGGTCDDGIQNGGETDVDCGGPDCDGCDNGEDCEVDGDCMSDLCDPVAGECEAPTCTDGLQNGDETDVDCGGPDCTACDGGEMCLVGTDCTSEVCTDGICEAPTCDDGVMNGFETDVDCGGGDCPPCDTGDMCITIFDCQSMVCLDEECQAANCNDGLHNGLETDVDCGGPECHPCETGEMCLIGSDCVSDSCDPVGLVCEGPSCDDGVMNGDETDVDCGGLVCDACEDGEMCIVGLDCESLVCNPLDLCEPAACDDGLQNGDETDLDCGGSCGMTCEPGESCLIGGDCISAGCNPLGFVCNDYLSVTASPSCSDFGGVPVLLDSVASGGTGGPYTYAWTPDDGSLTTPALPATLAAPAGFATYTVTVDDGFNLAQDEVVVVNASPFDLENNCTLFQRDLDSGATGPATVAYSAGGTVACELGNNEFGLHLCSTVSFEDSRLQGTIEITEDNGDNDMIGLVWGAQDESHFYSLTWKAGAQPDFGCTVPEGVVVKMVDAPTLADLNGEDVYCAADTPNSTLLAAPADGLATGWVEGESYTVTIDYTTTQSDITITRDSDGVVLANFVVVDGMYPSGSFGSTTLSQANACVGPLFGSCL